MTTTTMPTVDELERTAQDAAAEAAEAEQLVATLEERVLDGDDDVQPEQIEAQRSLSRFAGLRAEAAHRKVQRAQAARQAALIADLDAAVTAAVKPGGKCSAPPPGRRARRCQRRSRRGTPPRPPARPSRTGTRRTAQRRPPADGAAPAPTASVAADPHPAHRCPYVRRAGAGWEGRAATAGVLACDACPPGGVGARSGRPAPPRQAAPAAGVPVIAKVPVLTTLLAVPPSNRAPASSTLPLSQVGFALTVTVPWTLSAMSMRSETDGSVTTFCAATCRIVDRFVRMAVRCLRRRPLHVVGITAARVVGAGISQRPGEHRHGRSHLRGRRTGPRWSARS